MKCNNCGFENLEEMKFCGNCGAKLKREEIEEEFRIVSILFIDMVGYTKLSRNMETEALKNLINSYFEIMKKDVEFYDGKLVKYIGDATLSIFGYPNSHENDAERAILAALKIRDDISELNHKLKLDTKFRYGINVGKVIVGKIGDTIDFIGEEVNLAERIQEAAEDSKIYISEKVYKLIKGLFEIKDADKKIEISEDISERLYEISGKKLERGKVRGIEYIEQPMIGREKELLELQRLFRDTLNKNKQNIISILGEAGIGKTRLYEEFEKTILNRDDVLILKGRCLPYGKSFSYWPLLEIVRTLLAINEGDKYDEISNKVKEFLINNFNTILFKHINAHHILLNFLGLLNVDELNVPEDKVKQFLFNLLEIIFKKLLANRFLVFVVEDLHWVDQSSIDFLKFILKPLSDYPCCFILISRKEIKENELGRMFIEELEKFDNYHKIILKELSEEESMLLVEKILEIEKLPPDFKEFIIKHSEGNPFFMEEIIKSFIDEGILIKVGENWKTTKPVKVLKVPTTVEGVIRARLDKLPYSEKKIIQNAAIIGRIFWHNILVSISNMSIDEQINNLQAKDFIIQSDKSNFINDTEYFFKHILIQEVTYNSILKKIRVEIHKNVAELLEKNFPKIDYFLFLLAYHFENGNVFDKAAKYYLELGIKQKEKNINNDALKSFEKVLKYRDFASYEMIYAAYNNIASIYKTIGRGREAIEVYNQMITFAKDNKEKFDIFINIGDTYQRISEYQNALSYYNKAEEVIEDGWLVQRLRLNNSYAWIYYLKGDNEKLKEYADNAMEILEANEDKLRDKNLDQIKTRIYNLLGVYYGEIGENLKALSYYKNIEKIYLSQNKFLFLDACYNNMGTIYTKIGEFGKALDVYIKSEDISKETGDKLGQAITLNNIGEILFTCNDIEGARKAFDEYLKINKEIENKLGNGYANAGIARIYKSCGNFEKSIEKFNEAIKIFSELGCKRLELSTKFELIELHIDMENLFSAKEILNDIKIEKISNDEFFYNCYELVLAKLHCKENNYDKAIPVLEKLYTKYLEKDEVENIISIGDDLAKCYNEMKLDKKGGEIKAMLKDKIRFIYNNIPNNLKGKFSLHPIYKKYL